MTEEKFNRTNEIAEEIATLIELKREASKMQSPISVEIKVGYFNKWSKVKDAFSREE